MVRRGPEEAGQQDTDGRGSSVTTIPEEGHQQVQSVESRRTESGRGRVDQTLLGP